MNRARSYSRAENTHGRLDSMNIAFAGCAHRRDFNNTGQGITFPKAIYETLSVSVIVAKHAKCVEGK